jgi:hypothetical protein
MLPEEKVWQDENACIIIDGLLDSIKDGEWHDVRELMALVSPTKLERVLSFLAEYQFIEWNKQDARVRLDYATLDFLQKLFSLKRQRWKKQASR